MQCLNIKNPEVAALLEEYTKALGSEEAAYYVLSENDGLPLDRVPVRGSSTGKENSKSIDERIERVSNLVLNKLAIRSKLYRPKYKQKIYNELDIIDNVRALYYDITGLQLSTDAQTLNEVMDEIEFELNTNLKDKVQSEYLNQYNLSNGRYLSKYVLYNNLLYYLKDPKPIEEYDRITQHLITSLFPNVTSENLRRFKSKKQALGFYKKQFQTENSKIRRTFNNLIDTHNNPILGANSKLLKLDTILAFLDVMPDAKYRIRDKIFSEIKRWIEYSNFNNKEEFQNKKILSDFEKLVEKNKAANYEFSLLDKDDSLNIDKYFDRVISPISDEVNDLLMGTSTVKKILEKIIDNNEGYYANVAKTLLNFADRFNIRVELVNSLDGVAGKTSFRSEVVTPDEISELYSRVDKELEIEFPNGLFELESTRSIIDETTGKTKANAYWVRIVYDSVRFKKEPERVILHEITHVLTMLAVAGNPEINNYLQKYIDYINRNLPNLKNNSRFSFFNKIYGLSSPDEFVAEFFSNPDFQELLKSIPPTGEFEKRKSLWEEILERILSWLKTPSNLYEELLPAMEGIVQYQYDNVFDNIIGFKDLVLNQEETNPEIAPNGKPSKLFNDLLEYYKGDKQKAIIAKSQIYTESFKQWFGDWLNDPENASKVVDENGEPLIVYHTVNPNRDASFEVFDVFPEGKETMIYHTDDKEMSLTYGKNHKNFKTIDSVKQRLSEIPKEIENAKKYRESPNNYSEEYIINELGYDSSKDPKWLANVEYTQNTADRIIEQLVSEQTELESIIKNPKKIEYVKLNYVSLKNPLIIDGKGQNWNELSVNDKDDILAKIAYNDSYNAFKSSTEDRIRNEIIERSDDQRKELFGFLDFEEVVTPDEISELYSRVDKELEIEFPNGLFELESTRSIEEKYRKSKYDGIIFKNIKDYGGGTSWLQKKDAHNVFAAKNPNQVKSVDNQGTWSRETSNIYQASVENYLNAPFEINAYDVNMSISEPNDIKQFLSSITSTNSSLQKVISSINSIADIINVGIEYTDTPLNELYPNANLSASTPAIYIESGNKSKIIVYRKGDFSIYGGLANVLLHETIHKLTVNAIDTNSELRELFESIYKDYKKAFGYDKSLKEFVADMYSRPEVIDNIVSQNGVIGKSIKSDNKVSLFERLKNWFKQLFKHHNISDYDLITDVVLNKIINYNARQQWNQEESNGLFTSINPASSREELAAKDIAKNFDDIIKTVELRIKSLQYSNVDLVFDKKEINRAEKLNATLYNIRNTIKDGEVVDNLIAYTQGINHYIDTIQDSLSEAEYVLNQISNRLANPVIVSNLEKLQSLRTALDTFYSDYLSPHRNNVRQLLKSLQTQYNSNIYKNAIGEDVYNQLTAVLDYLNRQLSSSKMATEDNLGWIYANTVKRTVTDFLQKEMEEANDPTVEHALENWLTFEGDVSSFNRRFATITSSNHTVVRIIRKVIGDVYNSTRRQVYDKFAQIKGVIHKVNNPKDIFETDENGKRTGYIVRDRRYGVYQKDKYEWRQNWLEKNGLASFEELKLNPELFVKYQKDYNKFKADHAERRFTPEFYDIFANLSYETNMALSEVNKDIELILAPYIGKDGKPRFEEMSEEDYSRWEMAQSRKRNLANPYDYITGELKPAGSVEAKIAQELQLAYAKLQNGLKSKVNMEAFLKEMDEMSKVKGYTPDGKYTLYEAWLERNTRWETTEEFNEIASKQIKQDYGETYNKLYEARKNLLNLYRNSKYEVMYKSMPQEVKNKIKSLDVAMYKIRSKAPRLGLHHSLYNTELSSEVERNGGIATLTSDDYFLDNKGRKIYYSYLNRVVPKNKKFFKRVPNKNWAETSVESAYHNNNYDVTSQEAEQPKLSIKRYDNRKTYNKLMRDANFVAFRNTIINTIAEANEKLTYSVYKNSYKFPQVLGHIGNYIARKGLFTGIKEYTFDAFSITPDDELHGINNNTRPDGTELNIIPTMYTTMLNDPNLLTNDVVGAIMKYYRMACNYENKRKVAPQLNLLDTLVKSEGQIEKNGVIESAESSELEKQIHEYIGYHLYGRRQTLPEYNIKGNRVSLDKVFKAFATWGRDSGLAWNIRSAISGGLSAISFYFSDATINKHYNKRNFNQAVGIVTKDMLTFKQLAQLGKNMSSCKTFALLEYNGLSFNQEEDLSHANRWRVGRIIKRIVDPYAAFQMASFLPNSVLVNSVYLNYKLIKLEDGTKRFISESDFYSNFPNLSEDVKKQIYEHSEQTLLDAYEVVDGALKPKEAFKKYITEDLENEVSNIMLHLSSHAEGMVEEADKSGIYFNTALSTILMFRAFLPKNIENTVGNFKPYWNYQTKELTFPTLAALAFGFKYGSSYKLVNLIHNLKTNQSKLKNQEELEALKEKYKGTDVNKQIDKYIGRFNVQIMTYLFWCAIFYAVAAYTDGDDDDYFSSMLKLELNKVALESGSRYNVMDITSIFNSITPLTGTIEDIYKVIWLPEYFQERKWKKIKKGAYKGYYGWQRDLFQLIPPVKAYFNLRNPDEKLRDLQNRIK